MIRPIDIRLNAAHPELPLAEAATFTGSPSTVLIRGVPPNCGRWAITAVFVAASFPDNSTTTRAAVQSANGVWVATLPATATSGRTTNGIRVMADGIDENGEAVTGYILGVADFAVASLDVTPAPEPGETSYQMLYFDTAPATLRKGDVTKIDGVLKFYNGTAWEPFADLSNYYTAEQVDEAIDKLAAYYITADAQGNPFATHAALVNAQTYYSGGALRIPTRNDYAVVSADETHGGAEWRYIYAVDAQGVGQWEPQYAVEGVIAYDDTVTRTSANGVKSSGIWSAIWGALSALPTGFTSLYDWCVSQLGGKVSKTGDTMTGGLTVPNLTVGSRQAGSTVGAGSAAEGWHTTASGNYSHAEGYFTTASGTYSHAEGFHVKTQNAYEHAQGFVNASHKASETFGNAGNTLSSIGCGDNIADHKNAVETMQDGKTYIYGLGGYDGTNPTATGVKDLASAVNAKAARAPNPTAGNLAALDADGNPTDSGIAACDLLTIVTLSDSTETMASILARLDAINAAHKRVFFDCSGIDVNPRLYLCTIMIDATANAVRVYDQVTGKLYIGPYDATETIGEVFAKAVDAYHSITVSAVTLDGVTVTGQTVTIRGGTDATAPVYATATITDGAPVTFVVPKGMIYFLEITDTLADHFGPRITSGARQGIATADAAVTFTYYDAEHIDVSEITTFAKLQEALTWFGANETAARNNLVGLEIADTWTATNGTVYDNPRVVWDVHYFEDENGVSHLGALMGTKYCSSNDVQFDAAEGEECDSATETTAEADVYYYGLALGETSKTAANLTLLELSTGDALPYSDYAKIYKSAIRDTTRNSLQYGYNNWRDSAYRQYLNSDAEAGQWWGATHIGDVAPSQLNSVRGFMAGCSAALLAAAKKVKVATWPNYVTDGPNQITTLYETLDTFFLPSGSEVYGNVNLNSGESVEGELSPYWQARTAYTAPSNTAISTRIIYRELPVGSTANRSAAHVRLRSANRGHSYNVWLVHTSGQVYNHGIGSAYSAYASVPACVIY